MIVCCSPLAELVTMNEISSGSPRHREGSIDAGFNLGHKVGDRAFFDVILLIMFDPEVSCEWNKSINIFKGGLLIMKFRYD